MSLSPRLPCKVYDVKLKAGREYRIELSSEQFDPFLRVESPAGKELAFDDANGRRNARLVFTPPADGVYRVVASHNGDRLGAFRLTVTPTKSR